MEEETVEETDETSEEGTLGTVDVGLEDKGTDSAAYFIARKAFAAVSVMALAFLTYMFI